MVWQGEKVTLHIDIAVIGLCVSSNKVMFFFCLQRDLSTEGRKKRRQSTEGEEEGEGERRPLKLARAHHETLRTGKVHIYIHKDISLCFCCVYRTRSNDLNGNIFTPFWHNRRQNH